MQLRTRKHYYYLTSRVNLYRYQAHRQYGLGVACYTRHYWHLIVYCHRSYWDLMVGWGRMPSYVDWTWWRSIWHYSKTRRWMIRLCARLQGFPPQF